MRTFSVGTGRVQALAYTPDSQSLVVDCRDLPQHHNWFGNSVRATRKLTWWDIASGSATRRFRLRDSLYGPGGVQTTMEEPYCRDRSPDTPALDLAFSVTPPWVATVWEWTNKEDGVCIYDMDAQCTIEFRAPYKTHTCRVVWSPAAAKLLNATRDDMTGEPFLEVWDLTAPRKPADVDDTAASWTERERRERASALRQSCALPFNDLADLAFDGRFAAATDGKQPAVLLWDSHAAPPTEPASQDDDYDWDARPLEGRQIDVSFAPQCLAFAPNRSLLAAGGAGLAFIELQTMHCRGARRTGPAISALAFSQDGKELLAGTVAGTVERWDIDADQLRDTLDWQCGAISALAFAPDGATCAAGDDVGRIVVWDRFSS